MAGEGGLATRPLQAPGGPPDPSPCPATESGGHLLPPVRLDDVRAISIPLHRSAALHRRCHRVVGLAHGDDLVRAIPIQATRVCRLTPQPCTAVRSRRPPGDWLGMLRSTDGQPSRGRRIGYLDLPLNLRSLCVGADSVRESAPTMTPRSRRREDAQGLRRGAPGRPLRPNEPLHPHERIRHALK